MLKKNHDFKIGDSVKVKPKVQDPDFRGDITGWIGRILEIQDETISLLWDSLTLSGMPNSIISRCEQDGLDWSTMVLYPTDVEPTKPRDTIGDVEQTLDRLHSKHQWDYLGGEGLLIQNVLQNVESDEDCVAFEAWAQYLKKSLKLPFEAKISESQERGARLRQGENVEILEIADIDDSYGIIVTVSHKRDIYQFPLCDLEVIGRTSSNYQLVKAYAVWFASR